jgi:porin
VIDQMLYRVPGTDDQGMSAFVRAGSAPNDRNLINFYGDAGLVYRGLLPGRPDDTIGIATAYARLGENARELDADTATYTNALYPIRGGETMIELIYRAQLTKWWTLQPDLQYIIRPGGGVLNQDGSLRPNAWVVGLRTSLNF